MGAVPTKHIDGDATIGRNVSIGGKATVRGSATIGHNLRVEGWLEAKNIKGPLKGLFTTEALLNATYPRGERGWFALVGDELPAALWVYDGEKWVATGKTSGELVIDGEDFAEVIGELRTDVDELGTTVGELSRASSATGSRLATAEGQIAQQGAAIDSLRSEVPGIVDKAIEELSGEVETAIGTAKSELETSLATVADTAEAARERLSERVGALRFVGVANVVPGATSVCYAAGEKRFIFGQDVPPEIQRLYDLSRSVLYVDQEGKVYVASGGELKELPHGGGNGGGETPDLSGVESRLESAEEMLDELSAQTYELAHRTGALRFVATANVVPTPTSICYSAAEGRFIFGASVPLSTQVLYEPLQRSMLYVDQEGTVYGYDGDTLVALPHGDALTPWQRSYLERAEAAEREGKFACRLSVTGSGTEYTGEPVTLALAVTATYDGKAVAVAVVGGCSEADVEYVDGRGTVTLGPPAVSNGRVAVTLKVDVTYTDSLGTITKEASSTLTRYAPMRFLSKAGTAVPTGAEIAAATQKQVKSSVAGEYTIALTGGEYVWICVPEFMSPRSFTSGGFAVPMEAAAEVAVQIGQTSVKYKCYRTSGAPLSSPLKLTIA